MKQRARPPRDSLRPEYRFDYSKAVRGKYAHSPISDGANVVILDPDVARAFRSSAAVSEAIRALIRLTQESRQWARSTRSAKKP